MSHIISSSFTLLPPSPYLPLSEREGKLPFTLMNDYMFKAVFQHAPLAEDSIFEKVSDALYLLSQNWEVAEQCLRMQEAEAVRKHRENMEKQREEKMAQQEVQIAQQEAQMAQQEAQIAQQKERMAQLDAMKQDLETSIAEKDAVLFKKDAELEQLRAQLCKYQEQSLHN